RGPLGSGSGALVVVGDSALWAEPEEEARSLFPSYPLLWALLGTALAPSSTDAVSGEPRPGTVAWRFVQGADTTEYVAGVNGRREMVTDVRVGGTPVGGVYVRFDTAGLPE